MQLGVIVPNTGPGASPEAAVRLATTAEELGVESLWAADHVVIPTHYESRYPYGERASDSSFPPIAEPLMWLAYVAAVTTRIRLGTGVLVLPLRNPVLLAKQLGTLDVLSGGRVVVGVGVGWLAEEAAALGVPWDHRGERSEEAVAAMRALWRDDVSSFAGQHVTFDPCVMIPKPVQPGGPPVLIGGSSPVAARRAGRIGDGFVPLDSDPGVVGPLVATMRAAARDAGRDPAAIEVTCRMPAERSDVGRLAELGVTRVVTPPTGAKGTGLTERLHAALEHVRT